MSNSICTSNGRCLKLWTHQATPIRKAIAWTAIVFSILAAITATFALLACSGINMHALNALQVFTLYGAGTLLLSSFTICAITVAWLVTHACRPIPQTPDSQVFQHETLQFLGKYSLAPLSTKGKKEQDTAAPQIPQNDTPFIPLYQPPSDFSKVQDEDLDLYDMTSTNWDDSHLHKNLSRILGREIKHHPILTLQILASQGKFDLEEKELDSKLFDNIETNGSERDIQCSDGTLYKKAKLILKQAQSPYYLFHSIINFFTKEIVTFTIIECLEDKNAKELSLSRKWEFRDEILRSLWTKNTESLSCVNMTLVEDDLALVLIKEKIKHSNSKFWLILLDLENTRCLVVQKDLLKEIDLKKYYGAYDTNGPLRKILIKDNTIYALARRMGEKELGVIEIKPSPLEANLTKKRIEQYPTYSESVQIAPQEAKNCFPFPKGVTLMIVDYLSNPTWDIESILYPWRDLASFSQSCKYLHKLCQPILKPLRLTNRLGRNVPYDRTLEFMLFAEKIMPVYEFEDVHPQSYFENKPLVLEDGTSITQVHQFGEKQYGYKEGFYNLPIQLASFKVYECENSKVKREFDFLPSIQKCLSRHHGLAWRVEHGLFWMQPKGYNAAEHNHELKVTDFKIRSMITLNDEFAITVFNYTYNTGAEQRKAQSIALLDLKTVEIANMFPFDSQEIGNIWIHNAEIYIHLDALEEDVKKSKYRITNK